jgi:hypothetical protein
MLVRVGQQDGLMSHSRRLPPPRRRTCRDGRQFGESWGKSRWTPRRLDILVSIVVIGELIGTRAWWGWDIPQFPAMIAVG